MLGFFIFFNRRKRRVRKIIHILHLKLTDIYTLKFNKFKKYAVNRRNLRWGWWHGQKQNEQLINAPKSAFFNQTLQIILFSNINCLFVCVSSSFFFNFGDRNARYKLKNSGNSLGIRPKMRKSSRMFGYFKPWSIYEASHIFLLRAWQLPPKS